MRAPLRDTTPYHDGVTDMTTDRLEISRIDHVSLAVKDYGRAADFFQGIFSAVPGAHAEDSRKKFTWKIFSLGDLSRLELVSPTGQGSFLDGFLSDRDGGVHHITLQTPDILKARKFLDEKNVPYFGYNEYVGGIWKELFIHPRDAFGVLIQIAEFTAEDWLSPEVRFPAGKRWDVEARAEGADLVISHPGGGKARMKLTKNELRSLIADLEKAL
jgi:methylmalonyl-CoA/ethylmalonyl-CoA epimerase